MSDLTEQFAVLVDELSESLADIRRQIAENREQRQVIEARTATAAEAKDNLKAWIAARAERFSAESPLRPGTFLTFSASGHTKLADPGQLTDLMCWLHGPALEKKIGQLLTERADTDALPVAEKRAELARLDAECFELESAEERLIRQAAEARIKLPRRPDANPAVVLAD